MEKAKCLNCESVLIGSWCHHCGQRSQPRRLTTHHVLHDVLHEFLHFDGKIIQTVKLLLTAPGALTAAFLEGRRTAFVNPIRLYLASSIVMFGVLAAMPERNEIPFSPDVSVTGNDATPRTSIGELDPASREELARELGRSGGDSLAMRLIQAPIAAALRDPGRFRQQMLANASKAMFLLLPLSAVIALLFLRPSGRTYWEHLCMSLHLHAFWFLLLALANIMSAARWPPLQITADLLVLILLPWYLLAALRRVYGLDWKPTLIRGIATGATYAVALGVTISGLFLLTAA